MFEIPMWTNLESEVTMGRLQVVVGRGGILHRKCSFDTNFFRRGLSLDVHTGREDSGVLELWTWGTGEVGQLGLGDAESRSSPCCVGSISLPSSSSTLAPGEVFLRGPPLAFRAECLSIEHSRDERKQKLCNGNSQSASKSFLRSMHGSLDGMDHGVGIACGLLHSGLWADGKLWLWGKNSGGRLGLGSEQPQYSPTHVSSLADVKSVALGGAHSVAIANGGSLYTWGFGVFGALGHGIYTKEAFPKKLTGAEWMDDVKHVAAGGSHTAAISSSGDLYTWGRDEGDGRLGHGVRCGSNDGAEPFPIKVEALPTPVAAVACGGFCTMALTPEGQLWSWGGNRNYELGRGHSQNDWRPKPVPETENMCIIQVACGGFHSAAVTDDGKVLTWGHGGYGQLGHGSLESVTVPCVVEGLADQHFVSVSCGYLWTAAVTASGELYTWGKNCESQIGVPNLGDRQMTPALVSFDEHSECSSKKMSNAQSTVSHVICVSAGATHGMSLVYRI